MVVITKGNCHNKKGKTMNSKERYKIRRMHKRWEERNALLAELGDHSELKVSKSIISSAPRDDLVMKSEPKDDALHRAVNHAHQRSPGKKWS